MTKKKPYGFVPLPDDLDGRRLAEPVWHDGSGSPGRLSGEIRLTLTTLTPLLVGWERVTAADLGELEPQQEMARDLRWGPYRIGTVYRKKAILIPLRAPWGARPVLIPGDSLKGLLRHELGTLLGAPMERVAERSYSYRPNSMPVDSNRARLVPRIARVVEGQVAQRDLPSAGEGVQVRVPLQLELLPIGLRYAKNGRLTAEGSYAFTGSQRNYRRGMGAGQPLPHRSEIDLHDRLQVMPPDLPVDLEDVPDDVIDSYVHTLRHLLDTAAGHFSARHPDIAGPEAGEAARDKLLEGAQHRAFQPGDLIWVEWDTTRSRIVSFGWHYYYRWAYQDTIRTTARRRGSRPGLFPLPDELDRVGDAPAKLSAVRRLFGYTGDNEGSAGIGHENHSQLMGRISVNAALEVVGAEPEQERFLEPTFLKELGMPRPSAVEHYIQQPVDGGRPGDGADLYTYGDAEGYDPPGKLAGRKFYLDRPEAYSAQPWVDTDEDRYRNERSTVALEASRPGRAFRFTVRFRDLDPAELAAVLLALCPDQFAGSVGGVHPRGYCSKLGYARPLGWGSVRIAAHSLHLLEALPEDLAPALIEVARGDQALTAWFEANQDLWDGVLLKQWLDVHRCHHPEAGPYPRENGQIFTYHANLRAEHTRKRRMEPQR